MYLLPVVLVILIGGGGNIQHFYRLVTDGVPTTGLVIDTEPNNHSKVRYRYRVGDQTYDAASLGGGGHGNPDVADLRPGDPILVYYLRSDPRISGPGTPQSRLSNELAFIALVVGVFALVTIGNWLYVKRRPKAAKA